MHLPSSINQPLTQQDIMTDEKTVTLSQKTSRPRKGFTLIEILVVMAIIATLLGLGVGAIKNMASSKGVSTAVPLAESIFKHAREIAKSTGTKTLVVVYADEGDNKDMRERYLRMIGIAQTNNGTTRLVTRPVTLPSNTYYNGNLSGKSPVAAKVAFPGSTDLKDCYTYGFNSEGNMSTDLNQKKQFIVQAGKLRPGQDAPDVDSNNSRDVGGFKIWSNGTTAIYRSSAQILNDRGTLDF